MTVNEKAIKSILKALNDGSILNHIGEATEALLRLQAHDALVARLDGVTERLTTLENKLSMATLAQTREHRPRGI